MRRLPDKAVWPSNLIGKALTGNAEDRLRDLPDECAALAVTSPPYWDVVDYGGMPEQIGQSGYGAYLSRLMGVWKETERALIPNGKLAIVTPITPIPKKVINDQHTRHLKNIAADIEAGILEEIPSLKRLSLFVWQKQTLVKMFGSYPYPPNIYEDNTIEFINVFVKDGAPAAHRRAVQRAQPPDAGGVAQSHAASLANVPGRRDAGGRASRAVSVGLAVPAHQNVHVRAVPGDGVRGRPRP